MFGARCSLPNLFSGRALHLRDTLLKVQFYRVWRFLVQLSLQPPLVKKQILFFFA